MCESRGFVKAGNFIHILIHMYHKVIKGELRTVTCLIVAEITINHRAITTIIILIYFGGLGGDTCTSTTLTCKVKFDWNSLSSPVRNKGVTCKKSTSDQLKERDCN